MIPRPPFDLAAFNVAAAREAFARAAHAEAALRRVSGLLQERRWWNDNVWAAEQIANDALAAKAGRRE